MTNETTSKQTQNVKSQSGFLAMFYALIGCFKTVQLAIVLLSGLAIGVLIGVFIPQTSLIPVHEIKEQFGQNYRWMNALSLFNVYGSPWFIALEVLFFFNLLFGSFRWLKPAYHSATKKWFKPAQAIGRAKNHVWFETTTPLKQSQEKLTSLLRRLGYGVHTDNHSTASEIKLYATKGNFSRLGPVVAHLGILCLLIASVYGAFTGFTGQKQLVPGESFLLQSEMDEFTPKVDEAFWKGSVPDYKIILHDFNIRFYAQDPSTPQQYISDVSVVSPDTGELVQRKSDLSVNYPLTVGDFTLYQANYAPTGRLFFEIDGQPQTLTVNTQFQDRPVAMAALNETEAADKLSALSLVALPFFVKNDPGIDEDHVRLFLHNQDGFIGAAPGKMPDNLKLAPGESGAINGKTIRFIGPEIATGLQIKKAPETPWIYASFAIIAIGTVMCVFSQRQYWFSLANDDDLTTTKILFHGHTNKAWGSFYKEQKQLQASLASTFLTEKASGKSNESVENLPSVRHNQTDATVDNKQAADERLGV